MTDDTRPEAGGATWGSGELCMCGHPADTCLHAPFRGQPYRRIHSRDDTRALLQRLVLLIARACNNAELAKKHDQERVAA